MDVVKKVAPVYAPVIGSTAVTIGCIILSHNIAAKRTATAMALAAASEKALKEYKSEVERYLTPEEKKDLKDRGVGDIPDINPDTVAITGKGCNWWYDPLSGQTFQSSAAAIKEAIAEFNGALVWQTNMSLNDLYEIAGMRTCELGDIVGWTVDNPIKFHFDSKNMSSGEACGVLIFDTKPTTRWRDL